jgi:hypothetical protein
LRFLKNELAPMDWDAIILLVALAYIFWALFISS